MQAKFTREADFRQERDFGAKIGATFEFLQAHGRPLGKCLLYFVLPPSLLMGVLVGISQSHLWKGMGAIGATDSTPELLVRLGQHAEYGGVYWLGILAMLISYIFLAATVYGYLRLRLQLPPEQEVTPAAVWTQIRATWFRLLFSSVVVIILSVVGLALLLVPGIYLSVALSLVWAVQVLEGTGADKAVRRSLNLTSGKWWSTLGLTFVMSLIIGLLGVVFQIPQGVVLAGKVLHWQWLGSDVLLVAASIVASVFRVLLYTPLLLAIAFQYFNLVERKEGVGLRTLVSSLGAGPAPVAYNHSLRPDDDGEY